MSHIRIEKVEGVRDRWVVWLTRDNLIIGWIVRHEIRTDEFCYENSTKINTSLCSKCLRELAEFIEGLT